MSWMLGENDEIELPLLPVLADLLDDGTEGALEPGEFALDDGPDFDGLDDLVLGDEAADDRDSDFEDEDGKSWLNDDSNEADVGGDEDGIDTDATREDGWLDDRPMDLDVGLHTGADDPSIERDAGLEGLDEASTNEIVGDGAAHLPPLPSSDSDEDGVEG